MAEQTTQWDDNDAAFLTDRVASHAHDAIDVAATRLAGAEERARGVAATTLAKLEATQATAKQTVGATRARLGTFLDGKPIAAVGCAFTVGVVAAALLRRR